MNMTTLKRHRIADPHLVRYLRFLALATCRQMEGSVSRQFFTEARIRYRQYQGSGCERMRWATWIALKALGGAAPAQAQPPFQREEKNPSRGGSPEAQPRASYHPG
jgi:hypothetical protein